MINVKIDDTIRVEFPHRAHSFPVRLAIALVEVFRFVDVSADDLISWREDEGTDDGRYIFQIGTYRGSGETQFEAFVDLWERCVSK